jgi:hypothetical protein
MRRIVYVQLVLSKVIWAVFLVLGPLLDRQRVERVADRGAKGVLYFRRDIMAS